MVIVSFIFGIILVISGFFCFFNPTAAGMQIGWYFGLFILIAGASAIFEWAAGRRSRSVWNLIGGIIGAVFGLFLLISDAISYRFTMLIVIVVAIGMMAYGVCKIIASTKLYKYNKMLPDNMKTGSWLVTLIIGIVIVVLGALCFLAPVRGIQVIGWTIGIYLVSTGIDMLSSAFMGMRVGR